MPPMFPHEGHKVLQQARNAAWRPRDRPLPSCPATRPGPAHLSGGHDWTGSKMTGAEASVEGVSGSLPQQPQMNRREQGEGWENARPLTVLTAGTLEASGTVAKLG